MTDASAAPSLPLTPSTRVVASGDQVSAHLEGETVILSMAEGVYYGLDRVGTRVWDRFAAPVTLGEVHRAIVAEFDVGHERAWDDLVVLTRDLLARGLVVRLADPPG